MVKKDTKTSIAGEDGEESVLNENGKRQMEGESKTGAKRIKTKSLYRQPTVKELNRLQETENLFNSNLFRLQVDEILQEVKVKEKTVKKFSQWFAELKNHLNLIPTDDMEYDLSEQILLKKLKVKLPIHSAVKKTKCMFKFHKFNDVKIVGSFGLECAIDSKLRVDLEITVPADVYTKNDSINYRYHKKRAAYLACIASHLTKYEAIEDLSYTWLNGCETKPVLDFKPVGKLGNHLSARILLACEAEAYKLHRYSPSRNNLRNSWLLGTENAESNTEVGPPTPHYNSSVLQDITAEVNHDFLNETFLTSDNLKQAVVLLKIWLRQRNLAVSGHVISLLVAYFVQTKRINNIMSSYQIVRNIWIALKTTELDIKGISLHKGTEPTPAIEEFHEHFPVVFVDKTGYYNICWQMTQGTYNALKRECTLAVEMLDNAKINSFIPLFMVPFKPLCQFDQILRFKNLNQLKDSVLSKVSKEDKLNYGVDELSLVTATLYNLLAKGLGRRVDLILPMVDVDFSWPVKKSAEKVKDKKAQENVSFGFILNPDHATNVVEKGPPANLPEAEEFRSFWGGKSELRRFQDGSITEACVWRGDCCAERRTIVSQIVEYLIQLKFGVAPSELFHVGAQLDSLTVRKQYVSTSGVIRAEEACARAVRTFDALRTDLRTLTQLPLDVAAVYGTSPVFSYSDPLPPVARAPGRPWRRGAQALIGARPPPYTPACEAVIELGHSGKWPGELQAFRCLKAAFHLQLASRLRAQLSLPAHAHASHVDVLKDGLVFRLRVAHPKEVTLLRRVAAGGRVAHVDGEDSARLLRDTVLMPRLRGALHGLHQQHPSFGPAAMLFRRWVCAHLLAPLVPRAACELLAARAFVRPEPLAAPRSPLAGLLRALRLLVDTDWASETVLLDFNGDMTHEEISEIERKLSAMEPPPALRLVTSLDGPQPAAWTRAAPAPPALARLRALAASALHYFETALMDDFKDNVLGAFIPSLSGFDAILHLSPALVPHAAEGVARPAAPQEIPDDVTGDVVPVVEFDPVRIYLKELRSAYGEFAQFFHDACGGCLVAVLWRPGAAARDWQPLSAAALVPAAAGHRLHKEALLQDFQLLGKGLVTHVTVP